MATIIDPPKSRQTVTLPNAVMDVDGHEFSPHHLWGSIFGGVAETLAKIAEPMLIKHASNDQYNPAVNADDIELNPETVWNIRGVSAPGAFDFDRRLPAMDLMGIDRQLVFPSYGIFAMLMLEEGLAKEGSSRTISLNLEESGFSSEELGRLGVQAVDEYNNWASRMTALDPNRLRMVAYIKPTPSVDDLMDQARHLISIGIKAVQITYGKPPGARSPAHPDLDPFWALLAENDIAVTLHVGGESGFLSTSEWAKAPAFARSKSESYELGLEPYSFNTLHLPICNWLTCMVLGGVFERHPTLRFGALELGMSWLGAFAEGMDMWATGPFKRRLAPFLSKLPSEYLAQNVRVTPYNGIESPEVHLARYPHLISCYCYSSDYPHMEGGKNSKQMNFDRIAGLGQDVVDKFFVENAKLLLPD